MEHFKSAPLWARVLLCVQLAGLGALSAVVGAHAVEPGWYGEKGEGVFIGCGTAGCAAFWFAHDKSGDQIWLISRNNCPRSALVCEYDFAVTDGRWRADQTVVGDASVYATVVQTGETSIEVEWDARLLFPEQCGLGTERLTPGGLIFRKCVGVADFDLIAR